MPLDSISAEGTVSCDDWSGHLSDCGLRRMRGQPLALADIAIPDEVVVSACQRFLEAVDAVLASAIAAPATGDAIELALTEYDLAAAECIGATLYLGPSDAEGLLGEIIDELDSARDALATMHERHWAPQTFYAAVARIEQRRVGNPSGMGIWFYWLSWGSPDGVVGRPGA